MGSTYSMLKCVLQYFDTFCFKLSENFNSFHIRDIISDTALYSNSTDLPLTYHIRVPRIDFYVHRITSYVSGQWFDPHNELLRCSCYIGTDAHLLFTKAPISEFQDCLGKLLYPLDFFQFHPIVILVLNEWFGWLHTIWVWNGKISLLSFCDFIFPHPYPIILLLCLCHLWCLDFYFFFHSNDLIYPLHVAFCWDILITTCF